MNDEFKKVPPDLDQEDNDKGKFDFFSNPNYKIHPRKEAVRIMLSYGLAGVLWILLSDELLSRIVSDVAAYKKFAMYKGWIYVAVTMLLIYILIVKRMKLFNNALKKIYNNFEELSAAHEELIALEEELRTQYNELEVHRNALGVSKQRYELAVEGADCGIWDWDVEGGVYYISPKWKSYLGYNEDEIENTFMGWANLICPEEREYAINKVESYLLSKKGSYENIYRMTCKSGDYKWILSKGKAIWNEDGKVIRVAGSHTDISEQKFIEGKLNDLVYYDSLTDIPNRLSFEIKATQLISEASRVNRQFALVYLDIDDFKNINDTLGHSTGDLLLRRIANILKKQVKVPDYVARLSGDEFGVIFDFVSGKEEVVDKIQELLKYLRKPWNLEGQDFFISFSIGIAMYPEHGNNVAVLLKNSDMAMYYVKKNLKDNYSFYLAEMQEKNIKNITMINELRGAIENNEFELYYQPIIDLRTGFLVSAEALIRWIHPEKGMVPPMEFIPLAEETGLIYEIGKWVVSTAFLQKKEWEDKGYPALKVSINISGKRITNKELIDDIGQLILETGLKSSGIQIEVTETAVMTDINASVEVLKQIKSMGVSVALDDFGTGYSSLTYLQKLPIDMVKLDRDFIKHITSIGDDHVIVDSIIKLTHELGLQIIAEGIETKEQLALLKNSTCDYGQGYLFSRPLPKDEMEKLLAANEANSHVI